MTGFLTEIDEQPNALRATLNALKPQMDALGDWRHRLLDGRVRRIIFSGMGASYFATIPAQLNLVQHGIDAQSIEASELLHYQLPVVRDDTLIILVSQSGRSVEIVKLLNQLEKDTAVIGITNNGDNPLAQQSDVHLQIQAGDEATVSSKTYTCSLATLHLLVRTLAGEQTGSSFDRLYALADAMEAALPAWREQAEQIVEQVAGSQTIVYLGRGASQASALTGALITKESCKFPTEGMNTGQFRHGPMEIVDARISTFVFAGRDRMRERNLGLAREIAQLGGRVIVVDSREADGGFTPVPLPADFDPWLLPLLEIVPVHCFAARFAAHQGYTPGDFRYLGKVTTKE